MAYLPVMYRRLQEPIIARIHNRVPPIPHFVLPRNNLFLVIQVLLTSNHLRISVPLKQFPAATLASITCCTNKPVDYLKQKRIRSRIKKFFWNLSFLEYRVCVSKKLLQITILLDNRFVINLLCPKAQCYCGFSQRLVLGKTSFCCLSYLTPSISAYY